MNGLSPVTLDVIATVLCDTDFWPHLKQLVKVVKPIVDAIGNVEARDARLADCMLDLIRCAQAMICIPADPEDDVGFTMHTRAMFNQRFHVMDTNTHSLALFLHSLCQKLAISQTANGWTFEFMVTMALSIAKQCKWSKQQANKLQEDLR
jgi:hypothetical protein